MINDIKRAFVLLKNKGLIFTIKKSFSIYMPWFLIRFPAFLTYPQEFQIEPTNLCNFRCPLCSNNSSKRKKGVLSFDKFKQIINNLGVKVKLLNLTLDGEPLLNKDIFKMVKYARGKKISKIILFTNGSTLHKFSYDKILESGLSSLTISFDGATKRTFEHYRVGGDFNKIFKNAKDLCHEKIRRQKLNPNKEYPLICLQFLVMKHNEHEIEKMKQIAKDILKPDKLLLKSTALWTNLNKCEKKDLAKDWLPKNKKFWRYDDNLNIKGKRKSKYLSCSFLFDQTLILWNGDVVLCCLDFEGQYKIGNIFEEPYKKIFKSKRFNDLRKKIYTKQLKFCDECDLPNQVTIGESIYYDH